MSGRNMSGHAETYRVMPKHVRSCQNMSRHVVICQVLLKHVTSWWNMSRHAATCHVTPQHVTSCRSMSRHAAVCHVMRQHVTSRLIPSISFRLAVFPPSVFPLFMMFLCKSCTLPLLRSKFFGGWFLMGEPELCFSWSPCQPSERQCRRNRIMLTVVWDSLIHAYFFFLIGDFFFSM